MSDNTQRFTHTVEHYQQFSPSYPAVRKHFLLARNIIHADTIVVAIGAGT